MFDSTTGEVTAQGEVVAARNQNSDWQRLTQDKRRVAEALEVIATARASPARRESELVAG